MWTLNPPSSDEPTDNNNGDLWVDLGECPPVLKIWSDCEGAGQWYELTGGSPRPIDPNPTDVSVPGATGSGTQGDPFVQRLLIVLVQAAVLSQIKRSFSSQTIGSQVNFIDSNAAITVRFNQPAGVIGVDGTYSASCSLLTVVHLLQRLTERIESWYIWCVLYSRCKCHCIGVAKGSISPNSGEEGDTFTGTASLTGAVNPTLLIWELDGLSVQETTNTSNSNTYTAEDGAGSLTYRQK